MKPLTTHTITRFAGRTLFGGAFALSMIASLFVLEAGPFRFALGEAEAWQCVSLTASPSSIVAGDSSTLTWSFGKDEPGVYVTISGLDGQQFPGTNGSVSVSPATTTEYTATARRASTTKTFSCKTTITVTPPPPAPVCTISATPSTVVQGSDATLTWTSTNGATLSIDGGIGAVSLNGTRLVSPATTTVYTATVTDTHNRSATCTTKVTVTDPQPGPACTFVLSPSSIQRGSTTTLSWQSTNVASVQINQGIGTVATSGSQVLSPATTTAYTGTFTGTNGDTVTCGATVTVTDVPVVSGPTCAMNISPSRVSRGAGATLSWSSTRTASTTIDRGIGAVATSGSTSITVDQDTLYTGTFTASDGSAVTCSASVSVETGGGGGRCINCGNNNDDDDDEEEEEREEEDEEDSDPSPTIVLAKTVTSAGGFITLDQVPYTGFTAGPFVTALFWVTVLMVSVLIAWFITYTHPLARLRMAFSGHARNTSSPTRAEDRPYAFAASVDDRPIPSPYVVSQGGATTVDSLIEELAHDDHILLSPEALRALKAEAERTGEQVRTFVSRVFEGVKATYAREDGWILLSKERAVHILNDRAQPATLRSTGAGSEQQAPVIASPLNDVGLRNTRQSVSLSHVAAEASAPAPSQSQPMSAAALRTTSTAPQLTQAQFMANVVSGNEQAVFAELRKLSGAGSADQFISGLVRALDDVYKHRLEGNHNPDRELAQLTATWSNGDFEQVLGILVECVDYSYTSNRIGTKVALAKLFEHFKRNA